MLVRNIQKFHFRGKKTQYNFGLLTQQVTFPVQQNVILRVLGKYDKRTVITGKPNICFTCSRDQSVPGTNYYQKRT